MSSLLKDNKKNIFWTFIITLFIIGIFIFFYFYLKLYYNISFLTNTNYTSSSQLDLDKKILKASVILYNNFFAEKEKGNEDPNWNKKLYNQELNITLDELSFKNSFIVPDNIANGKWVTLIMPKF